MLDYFFVQRPASSSLHTSSSLSRITTIHLHASITRRRRYNNLRNRPPIVEYLKMSTQTQTNEELPSKTIDHITSYPVVSTSIETFKSQPLGRKSLDLTQTGYDNIVAPFIPYARRPYGYVAPYVSKADSLANTGLDHIDASFPIVKSKPDDIKSLVLSYAAWPFKLADQTKTHVFETYSSEYDKCSGPQTNGQQQQQNTIVAEAVKYITSSKALITTSLILTSESLAWLSAFVSARRAEGEQFARSKYEQGAAYASSTQQYVHAEGEKAVNAAKERVDQARSLAVKKGEDVRRMTDEKINGRSQQQ